MRQLVKSFFHKRLFPVAAALLAIVLGLALRKFGYSLQLPFVIVKYGGSIIWGAMVYFVIAIFPAAARPQKVALLALGLATIVELSRLYHTPDLDAFRMTMAGALLLGRVFSIWNIVAYAVGISLAFRLDLCRLTGRWPLRDQ